MRITLAAAALALALPAAAQDTVLRMHHFAAPHAAAHALLAAPWAAKLEKDSGGRLRFEVSPALELGGGADDLVEQVLDGFADIVLTRIAFNPGRFPRSEVFELPLLGADAASGTFALQEYYERHLREEYAAYQVLLLSAHEGSWLHATRPVRRLEDWRRLKIGMATRGDAVFLRALGATPVGAPAESLAAMLEKGLLDGALLPFHAAAEHGLPPRVRHHLAFAEPPARPGTSVLAFLMNREKYAALPADLQRLIDAHSGRNLAWYASKTWSEAEGVGLAAAQAAGHELARLASAEGERLRAALAPELARALAELSRHGFDAAALYADAKALIAKHQKP